MGRLFVIAVVFVLALAMPSTAFAGHGLEDLLRDHPAPSFAPTAPPQPELNAGGQGAQWEHLASIPTGNPHSDLDFFTQGGDSFASVGTLAFGPNGGGQSIVRLTEDGEISPEFVSAHPSATCFSNPNAALGLQHDVEATPKGGTILNARNRSASADDAQLLVDATDQRGRCHDEVGFGTSSQPRGGLELVDITDVENPKEIGLIGHSGESHTVNVDPKRPHIAYAVTSDSIAVSRGQRQNEVQGSGDRFDLDGFEVVDMSSCMNFPADAPLQQKRDQCRPQVYRYRYPTTEMALGHTDKSAVAGCHELEVYANDRLTCGSINALLVFDMSAAFDDNGTPDDFTDDTPRGTPLDCRVRGALTSDPITTGAQVTDCVDGDGDGNEDLNIPNWLAAGAPSLEGVGYLGTVHHMGRGGPFDSTEDISVNHEAELTDSRRFLLATDERGGGVTPPGATCLPGVDNKEGNGGVHAYDVRKLSKDGPGSPEEEWEAYARTPEGEKAIFRVPVRTKPQATVCTAHVFHQIPGQNRIFMGWYSQGTQVIDFVEHRDRTFEFKENRWFIPAHANEWVSAIFKFDRNEDGTFTYYGATGDFNLGEAGRNTIDVYKVTLPPPPETPKGGGKGRR